MHPFTASIWLLLLSAPTLLGQSPVVQECRLGPSDTLPRPEIEAEVRRVGGPTASTAVALRLCGDSTKWMAIVDLPDRDIGDERGWRVALLIDSAGGPHLRYVTTGFMDSHRPELRLFRSGLEHLVLIGLGDEGGSWGMAAFDVGPFQVSSLGILDVGLPAESSDPGNDQSALMVAHVERRVNGWQVGFGKPIALYPNQDRRVVRTPARGQKLWFRPGGDWRLAP